MPLIEANSKGKTVTLEVQLHRQIHATLTKYLRYCRADKDKVVAGALELLFKEDKDFGPWLKKHPPYKRDRAAAGTATAPPSGEAQDTE